MNPLAPAVVAATLAVAAAAVTAQVAGATVRGQLGSQEGPHAGALVVATQLGSGFAVRTTSGADGGYLLPLLPPGRYRIVATAAGYLPSTQLITLRAGQDVSLHLTLEPEPPPSDAEALTESVVIVGDRDNRTSELVTRVTPQQIELLPQATRNFLAFADLAPGVAFETLGDGSMRLRGGALPSAATNVYIDGVAQKDFVRPGGLAGQEASRGSPFPQSAIAEYQVITQNYRAEYDQLSSVAVAAVTKSGGSRFEGEAFWGHSAGAWRAATPAERAAGRKAASRDDQYGLSMGGPLLNDRAHWFVAYEGKRQDTPKTVALGLGRTDGVLPPALRGSTGPAHAPFDEELLFAKLDASLDDANLLELSLKLRREHDTTGIGGANAPTWGTRKRNDETRAVLHWQRSAATWVNDLRIAHEQVGFNPRARTAAPGTVLTTADPTQVVLNAGGGREFQDKGQRGWTLQNDVTHTGFEWHGNHVIKFGAKLRFVQLWATEQNPFNPQFFYDVDAGSAEPYRVQFGAPVEGSAGGRARSRNTQLGLYAQDDWEINNNLTLNLGLRWDYERSPGYLGHVTPADVAAALRGAAGLNAPGSGIAIGDYISTGRNRAADTRAWQPRVGFSFDLNADHRHVIFGGYGRAYDRNLFDFLQLERTRGSFPQLEFQFDTPGHGCSGATCLAWDPAYLDPAVLRSLARGGVAREIMLLHNRLRTPYADQFSFGMRNRVGAWNTEVALSHVRSEDGLVFLLGNRLADGRYFVPGSVWGPPYGAAIPGFGSLVLGTNGLASRSSALLLKADKRYTVGAGWGASIAYTYTRAKENREFGQVQAFDYPRLADYGWKPAAGVARHRLVAVGLVEGPYDTVFSVRVALATPAPQYGVNCLASPPDGSGCVIDQIRPRGHRFLLGGPIWGYRQIDLAAIKSYKVPGGTLRLRADLINVLNAKNDDGYDTWWGIDHMPNPGLGRANGVLRGPTRTLRLGLAYTW